MTATRRLAAILAVDVVGYWRLIGEDEGGTARPARMRPRWTRRRPPLAEARRLNPKLSVKWLIGRKPVLPPSFVDAWRKAGLAEERSKFEGSLRERVRCSSLVDWPVYPRLGRTMKMSQRTGNLA